MKKVYNKKTNEYVGTLVGMVNIQKDYLFNEPSAYQVALVDKTELPLENGWAIDMIGGKNYHGFILKEGHRYWNYELPEIIIEDLKLLDIE